jgi:hypothetical protein
LRAGDALGALELGVGYYVDRGDAAGVGLPADEEERRRKVGEAVSELLVGYVTKRLEELYAEVGGEPDADPAKAVDASEEQEEAKKAGGAGGEELRKLARLSFETALSVGREDLLFQELYEGFLRVRDGAWAFSEQVEAHLLTDRLEGLPPNVMRSLVVAYAERGWTGRVEQCILHVRPECLDLHLSVGVCQSAGLYSALIYLYNAMGDYVTPAARLLEVVRRHLPGAANGANGASSANGTSPTTAGEPANGPNPPAKSAKETKDIEDAYKLYVYLAYILTGKAYPAGFIPSDKSLAAKSSLYQFLFEPSNSADDEDGDLDGDAWDAEDEDDDVQETHGMRTLQQQQQQDNGDAAKVVRGSGPLNLELRRRSSGEPLPWMTGRSSSSKPPSAIQSPVVASRQRPRRPRHANLESLLLFDSGETYRVLDVAFEDGCLNGDMVIPGAGRMRREFDRQHVVDCVVRSVRRNPHLANSEVQAARLYSFIARCVERYPGWVSPPSDRFSRALRILTSIKAPAVAEAEAEGGKGKKEVLGMEERERAVERILAAMPELWQDTDLAQRCESGGLWRAAESLYRAQSRPDLAIRCILTPPASGGDLFGRVARLIDEAEKVGQEQAGESRLVPGKARGYVFASLGKLVETGAYLTASIVRDRYSRYVEESCGHVESRPVLLVRYLAALLEPASREQAEMAVGAGIVQISRVGGPQPDDDGGADTDADAREEEMAARRGWQVLDATGEDGEDVYGDASLAEEANRTRMVESLVGIPLVSAADTDLLSRRYRHLYLDLLSQTHDGWHVYRTLRNRTDYDVDSLLGVMRRNACSEGISWLLERKGDFAESLDVMLSAGRDRIARSVAAFEREDASACRAEMARCGVAHRICLGIGQRWSVHRRSSASARQDEDEEEDRGWKRRKEEEASAGESAVEEMWFRILDAFSEHALPSSLRPGTSSSSTSDAIESAILAEMRETLRGMVHATLTGLRGHTSVSKLVRKLVRDQSRLGATLGEFREMVQGGISGLEGEVKVLGCVKQAGGMERVEMMRRFVRERGKGILVRAAPSHSSSLVARGGGGGAAAVGPRGGGKGGAAASISAPAMMPTPTGRCPVCLLAVPEPLSSSCIPSASTDLSRMNGCVALGFGCGHVYHPSCLLPSLFPPLHSTHLSSTQDPSRRAMHCLVCGATPGGTWTISWRCGGAPGTMMTVEEWWSGEMKTRRPARTRGQPKPDRKGKGKLVVSTSTDSLPFDVSLSLSWIRGFMGWHLRVSWG